MRKVDIIVIALGSPLLVGVYEAGVLIESLHSEEKSSDYIPVLFEEFLSSYDITHIVYANGPGSFMAIKMSYLFFKTLELVRGTKLLSASAFFFNGYTPLKAMGTLYFHYTPEGIVMKPLCEIQPQNMALPSHFELGQYSIECAPNYIIPAVEVKHL